MDASEVNIIAVGAGQIGLMLAAVCKQMNIRALVIEQHERVGDIWRKRYPTLALHTTRRLHESEQAAFESCHRLLTPHASRTSALSTISRYLASLYSKG